jgi:hypothetical protein
MTGGELLNQHRRLGESFPRPTFLIYELPQRADHERDICRTFPRVFIPDEPPRSNQAKVLVPVWGRWGCLGHTIFLEVG